MVDHPKGFGALLSWWICFGALLDRERPACSLPPADIVLEKACVNIMFVACQCSHNWRWQGVDSEWTDRPDSSQHDMGGPYMPFDVGQHLGGGLRYRYSRGALVSIVVMLAAIGTSVRSEHADAGKHVVCCVARRATAPRCGSCLPPLAAMLSVAQYNRLVCNDRWWAKSISGENHRVGVVASVGTQRKNVIPRCR